MSERLRESLSALMDDAADDLELARVLRAMEDDDEVSDTWSRYHLVSALLRGGDAGGLAEPGVVAIDVETRTAADDAADLPPAPSGAPRAMPAWLSFAAAATVTLAVVVALQWPVGGPEAPAVAATSAQDTGPVRPVSGGVRAASEALQRGRGPLRLSAPAAHGAGEAVPGASEAERQVDAYMLYHAEYAAANSASGMVPFARYAAFGGRR